MSAKSVASKLESLNTRLWQEAIRFEKMRGLVDDLCAKTELINLKYDDNYPQRHAAQSRAEKKLRELSWGISDIESKLQEHAWFIDGIVGDLQEI